MKSIFGWLTKHALLLLLLLAALIGHAWWVDRSKVIEAQETRQATKLTDRIADAKKSADELDAKKKQLENDLKNTPAAWRNASVEKLKARRNQLSAELGQKVRPDKFDLAIMVIQNDITGLKQYATDELSTERLEREIDFIGKSIRVAEGRIRLSDAEKEAQSRYNQASRLLKEFRNSFWSWTGPFSEEQQLEKRRDDALAQLLKARKDRRTQATLANGSAVIYPFVASKAQKKLRDIENKSSQELANLRAETQAGRDKANVWLTTNLDRHLGTALLVLFGIIAMPFLIRTIFYFVLAPLAERRASISIRVPGGGKSTQILPSKPSRVSVGVTLGRHEELLVRQDYLQSSSLEGRKATCWVLDYHNLLSSVAAGLVFLTRVRGSGELTTISAVRDLFAELTEVNLADGNACVLHPRALVAVVQPVGRHLRITSHWRLASLNAWLTLQLRYLVFHGPARLILKGGRGVRVERAERGRIFGQDQLVGFSADLNYSVTRTETFWPYFFGREQLFKDKVNAGSGSIIIEEAPLSARKGSGVRSGLEGTFDAAMKAFGL